jgi:hypothetical protein
MLREADQAIGRSEEFVDVMHVYGKTTEGDG